MSNLDYPTLFSIIDQLVLELESEGYPYNAILDALHDYVEISAEYLSK
jgi:hypothetical protein